MSGRRRALRGDGIPEHPQPFPPAIRIGKMIFSSNLGGYNPETGELPVDIAQQTRNAFHHMATAMGMGGGSLDDVAKVVIYLADRDDRTFVNPVWVETFPDDENRPVRHTVVTTLPGELRIQLEFTAVLPA